MTNQPKFLTEDELERLFAVVTSPRDLAILRVAYHRGLRASEIGALGIEDYRRDAKRLYVRRKKGSHSGEYPLTRNEVRALDAWVRVRGTEAGPLFPSQRGTGIDRRMLDVLMKRYGALAGLPADKRHMHVLKHSCGTHLLSGRGLDVAEVQDHLGHADIRNTMVYARITNRRRDEVGERLRSW
jgi:type 1 fimbriae regulatory protein FimB